jgi:Polyketide cyclase / dehydrase and lipid transport
MNYNRTHTAHLSDRRRLVTFARRLDLDVPSDDAWAVVADYRRDPEWRGGVRTMQPLPDGAVVASTTTTEVLRFAGRTYRIPGRVVELRDAGPERTIVWEATKAHGRRGVVATGARTCRVELDLHLHLGPSERLMAPLLVRLMRRRLDGDVARLATLLAQSRTSSNVTAAARPNASPAAEAAPRRNASGSVGSVNAAR